MFPDQNEASLSWEEPVDEVAPDIRMTNEARFNRTFRQSREEESQLRSVTASCWSYLNDGTILQGYVFLRFRVISSSMTRNFAPPIKTSRGRIHLRRCSASPSSLGSQRIRLRIDPIRPWSRMVLLQHDKGRRPEAKSGGREELPLGEGAYGRLKTGVSL